MDIITLILALVGIAISVFIAYVQHLQLEKSKSISNRTLVIGEETKSITEKLATDYFVQERANKLFPLHKKNKDAKGHYKVFYPVKYEGRPMPLISQGDFYAIHILSLAFGLDKLDLQEVEDDDYFEEERNSGGNTILICGPQANPVLNSIFPYANLIHQESSATSEKINNLKHVCNNDNDIKKWLKKDVGLPCWFMNEHIITRDYVSTVKKIQIYDKDDPDDMLEQPLESGAESCYRKAAKTGGKIPCGKVRDFGIFARVTKNNHRYLILSGIHQYGTWIVSDYLNNILRNKVVINPYIEIYENDYDFIAIIIGDYITKNMSVDYSGVHRHSLWVRKGFQPWVRYDKL